MYREEIKFNRGAFNGIESVAELETEIMPMEFQSDDRVIMAHPKTVEDLFVSLCTKRTLAMDRDDVYTGDLDRIASEVALEIQALGIVANRRIRKRRFVIVGTLDELLD